MNTFICELGYKKRKVRTNTLTLASVIMYSYMVAASGNGQKPDQQSNMGCREDIRHRIHKNGREFLKLNKNRALQSI